VTTAIINYGMGNIGSLSNAIKKFTSDYIITDDPNAIMQSSRIILPGVGAFPDAMKRLKELGLDSVIYNFATDLNRPVLGICLGMQLLASSSDEFKKTKGLNLIEGKIVRLSDLQCSLLLPHIGWNSVQNINPNSILLDGIPNETDFYFVHSFAYQLSDQSNLIAETNYEINFPSAIKKNNIFGTQFHPEKSSRAGMKILNNFLSIC